MKIKSIRKMGPELYLVQYRKRFGVAERYVVSEKMASVDTHWFYYRDTNLLCTSCNNILEWMIRNDVEFFDNFPEPWDGKTIPTCDLVYSSNLKGVPSKTL